MPILITIVVVAALLGACAAPPLAQAPTATVTHTATATATRTPTATATATDTPTATATRTLTPTATATDTPTATATRTLTPTATATATRTPTPTPTATATDTPTATPAPPTATPTPAVDFRVAEARLLSMEENGGCIGMHTLFITVLDASGAPLDGVVVGDVYGNTENVSGSKGPGRTEIDLFCNSMEIIAKRDAATGRAYTSPATRPLGPWLPEMTDAELVAAGYCANEVHCQWYRHNYADYCGCHYSWRVVLQRTW